MLFATTIVVLLAALANAEQSQPKRAANYGNRLFWGGGVCIGPEGNWNGARIMLIDCFDDLAEVYTWQLWSGQYKIEFKNAGNSLLDVAGGDGSNGHTPQVWTAGDLGGDLGGNQNQLFDIVRSQIDDRSILRIRTPQGTCLDVPDGAHGILTRGTLLQWFDCGEGNKNQLFNYVW